MFCCLIVCGLVLTACDAQERLTCLRNDDLVIPSPPSANENTHQGNPGPKGDVGPVGMKGLEGDSGIHDISVINSLKGKSDNLD